MTTVLVVDDESSMRKLLDLQLSQKGYHVITASSGAEALHYLLSVNIHIILLDVMMPEQDGFAVTEVIRASSQVPILFITARDDRDSMLRAFAVGGDDYMIKPFDSEELHARIQAIVKRTITVPTSSYLTKGCITMNANARTVTASGKKLALTLKEMEMLSLFMRNESRVLSREQLLERIWGIQYEGTTRTVDTHIKTLRIKLGEEAGTYIHTVWGVGYKFEVPHD